MSASDVSVDGLVIGGFVRGLLVELAQADAPREFCCLLVRHADGRVGVCWTQNVADDPCTGYEVDPRAQFNVEMDAQAEGHALVAIVHSHPNQDAKPSGRDVELAAHPELVYVIVGLGPVVPEVRGWRIAGGEAREVVLS